MQRLGEEGLSQHGRPPGRRPGRPPGESPPIFGIAGYKNSGKTPLIVELLRDLVARGWRVGTIKHAHDAFDIDHPGKDSYLHRAAGATEVIVASASRLAHIRELNDLSQPGLDELAGRMTGVDLVLVEGWKSGTHPRLELRRVATPAPAIAGTVPGILAIVSDAPLPEEQEWTPLKR